MNSVIQPILDRVSITVAIEQQCSWNCVFCSVLPCYLCSLINSTVFVSQFKIKLLSDEDGESPSTTPPDTTTIDELKRAFELVEVSSPGISDHLLTRIYVYLQHRCSVFCVCCVRVLKCLLVSLSLPFVLSTAVYVRGIVQL